MKQKLNLQITRLALVLAAAAGVSFPGVVRADDAAPAPAPAVTNTPEPAIAPETTNVPAATNPPTTEMAPAAPAPATNLNTMPALPPPAAPMTGTLAATPRVLPPPAYQRFNLGAEAGTTGFGGAVGWRFADQVALVGGMDYFNFSLNKTYSGIPYSGDARLQSERVGLNLYPWTKHSFYISFGAYFNQNRFTGSAVSDGSLTINGVPVPAGDSVHLVYEQQPVNGYVSIGGNLYFDKAHHFSLGTELGAFYLGNPKVNVTTTPPGVVPPADEKAYEQQVENDIKKVPVWPILRVSLNYSF